MNDSYSRAMFAPVPPPALLDEDIVNDEAWPLPEPREWKPAPRKSLLVRFKEWLIGYREEE